MEKHNINTLGALFFWNVEQFRLDPMLRWKSGDRSVAYSSVDFESAVLRLAKWFAGCGAVPGDRIGLYSENRPEWHIVDFAAYLAGLVMVPVYPTLSANQMAQILQHAGARVVFCGPEQMERLQFVRGGLPELLHAVSLDPVGGTENLDAILSATAPATSEERGALRARANGADPQSLATIVYTSGTTGTPKGVMLSHRNILFDADAALKKLPDRHVRQALSVLPLSHVLERILCYAYLFRGIPIAYGDPHDLRDLLALYHPEILGAVPRVLEKMRDAIQGTVSRMPAHRQALARFFLGAGYDHLDGKKTLRASLHSLAELLMFRKVRSQMGGILYFICGGAWLNPELERYFRALGFIVLQGYGLTETSPVVTFNSFGQERIGSVGQALEGVDVRVDEHGEILVRGDNVMLGYFRDPEATVKVIRDGWFTTGDLGRLDAEGFLTITGRRKEMLVLSNGKNIYYAPIEQALRRSNFVEQAFVIGEGRNYTSLILVPNMISVLQHASEHGILVNSDDELLLSAPVLELFRETIDALQAEFSRFEQAKRFCFLREEALKDPELVTPTEKVRRSVLERKYAISIEQLYRTDQPFVIMAANARNDSRSPAEPVRAPSSTVS